MKIEVRKVELPAESILHERISSKDFVDCFVVNSSLSARKAAEVIVQFPQWTQPLFLVRRILTAPFGLSNDGPPADDKVGAFPVELDTESEFVAGFDDKHQNFRVFILPFHVMIARNALKRVAQQG